MPIPRRSRRQEGTHALVDAIPFRMPVRTSGSQAFLAAFTIDATKAAALMPGRELHPYRIWNRALLLITVVDYQQTTIGKYIEFSIGIACTRGRKPGPRLVSGLFRRHYGFGQYVLDLPVSSEVSVKGGKGIWGMPKHQANLDFVVDEDRVSSQYDLDGQLAVRIDIDRPRRRFLPVTFGAVNYCQFRGLLMKSYVYFEGKPRFSLFGRAGASLTIGDHPRVAALKDLDISEQPLMTVFYPEFGGVLDDYVEAWMLTFDELPQEVPEGFEAVSGLGQGQEWLAPPARRD